MTSKDRIGFMQGRLSPLVDGRTQAFPWSHWRDEFAVAGANGFGLMEWTLDHERLYENPLMTLAGRREIRSLSKQHGVRVASLTGDCFMQAPFYKVEESIRQGLVRDFHNIVDACAEMGIGHVVVPLVDNGRIESASHEDVLRAELEVVEPTLRDSGVRIVFEADFSPGTFKRFIDSLPEPTFGVNYDIGNSASMGFDPTEEILSYGSRIYNVHVKDRVQGGTTVPLGRGNADFPTVCRMLQRADYCGNYVLQTARATDDDHLGALLRYRETFVNWLHAADSERCVSADGPRT